MSFVKSKIYSFFLEISKNKKILWVSKSRAIYILFLPPYKDKYRLINRKKYYQFISKILFLSIYLFLSYCKPLKKTDARIEDGRLNLSAYDSRTDGILVLQKNWAFYWNRFVTCDEFLSDSPPKPDSYINADKSWAYYSKDGNFYPGQGMATYLLKVQVDSPLDLYLFNRDIGTAYKLFLDSNELVEVGKAGNSENHNPYYIYKVRRMDFDKREMCIAYHVSNYSKDVGGLWYPPYLGEFELIFSEIEFIERIQMITSSILFIIGLYHAILFFYQRNSKYILYFSLLSFSVLLRQLSTESRFIIDIFPDISWETTMKIEYSTIVIPLYLLYEYGSSFFNYKNKYLRAILGALVFLFFLFIILTSVSQFSRFLQVFQIYVVICIIMFIYITIKNIVSKSQFSKYMLSITLVPFLFIVVDLLSANSVITFPFYLVPWGMVFFIFGQAYILSVRFSQAFERVKSLSQDLEFRTEELRISNKSITDLNRLLNSLNESLSLDVVMEKIMNHFGENYGLQYYILGIITEDNITGRIFQAKLPQWISVDDREIIFSQKPRIHGGKGAHSYAYRSREPLFFPKIRLRGAAEAERTIIEKLNIKSFLIVPLIVQNQIVGILDLWREGEFEMKKEEITQISILGEQLTGIIQNSILLEKVEREKEAARKAYLELEASQKQLVQSDRMITLGTMMAGIVHEINSPLGAIKANSENIQAEISDILQRLPGFARNERDVWKLFFEILSRVQTSQSRSLSTKEQRTIRKQMLGSISETVPYREDLVDGCIELGWNTVPDEFLGELDKKEFLEAIQLVIKFNGITKKSGVIEFSASRVAKIVKSLKSFMHFDQKEEMILADLSEGLEMVLIILHNQLKQGVEVIRNYDIVPAIYCYPDELNQIWTNLMNNSIQAMNGQGKIQIDLRLLGNEIQVAIEDNGPGIPPEIQKKIFEPFFTTKPAGEGSGLGLHIIGKILEKHRGRITLESEVGRTRFSIFLPARTQKET